jgi:predicted TIM-barrel fold metal-dependent hydrolase
MPDMKKGMVTRGSLLKGGGVLVSSGIHGPLKNTAAAREKPPRGIQVPYSDGRQYPTIEVPANACDCHHHIYDPVRFPYIPEDVRNQPLAGVDAYRLLQRRLGITRNVIVQPSAYGFDNACTLDALKQMGAAARAVVVIDPAIGDGELKAMNALGVRGIRFNIATGAAKDPGTITRLARRVHDLGWHVQFWMSARDTVDMESVLQQLPNPIVFDHRGHIPQPEGAAHPAFKVIRGLLEKGRAWVKLSGLYQDTQVDGPAYTDTVKVGKAFVEIAPERMVWGSDWPHPSIFSARKPWPDDAKMLDLLAEQAPDEALRQRILVTNPAILYGFDK